jgi:DNA-binding transcriptional LysR family regulator
MGVPETARIRTGSVVGDVAAGRLAPVLEDWRLHPLTINLAYQSRQHLPAKIRAFTDAMREYVRSSNLEARWNAV